MLKTLEVTLEGKNQDPLIISTLFPSMLVQVALKVIHITIHNRFSDEVIFTRELDDLTTQEFMNVLMVALNNRVFSYQGNIYKQLQGVAMSSPYSPVITKIYIVYFGETSLQPRAKPHVVQI